MNVYLFNEGGRRRRKEETRERKGYDRWILVERDKKGSSRKLSLLIFPSSTRFSQLYDK